MTEISKILSLLHERPSSPAVLATLTKIEGSSYRRPGARMLWFEDGRRTGAISGGCLEEDIVERARAVFASRSAQVICYDTTDENDLVWGTGTGCEGIVTVLLEYLPVPRPPWLTALEANLQSFRSTELEIQYRGTDLGTRLAGPEGAAEAFRDVVPPAQRLLVFGAGDDAQPLVEIAATLGWHVTVVDTRPAYATKARFPLASEVLCRPAAHAGEVMRTFGGSPTVVMTHRYRDDQQLLPHVLSAARCYVGLLGARKRTERLLAAARAEGFEFTEDMKRLLHAPVGLDLGTNTPAGVALSIIAEIQAVLARATALSLRDRPGPIHES